ncbi:MAG: glutathione S-transferase family protein [Pseudanabaena frigida]|uniref:Glutathione S-transferase family protein n=1 Tax=Pseudanabaena frigida TaxID=945775 RepID=A0A2W4W3J2_9CYAN|nr:MAG: glutathione S-transferase family protein [Pseudanabaena frigida]
MKKITVYGASISTYVRTVRLLLEEANAEYEFKEVGIFNGDNESPEYLAKHPFGKVPTIEFDGEILYETTAITEYLDAMVASSKFSPSEPLQLARMRQIFSIVDSYLYTPAISKIVVQRLIVPSQGGTADEELVNNAIAPVKKSVEAIETLIVGNPYLLGSEIGIADFYLIPIFIYLSLTPEFDVVTLQTPKLRTWWDRVKDLPTVKKVVS